MRATTIGAVAEIFDGPHATPTRTTVGPYFLNISSLNSGRLDLEQSDHVSDRDFKKWTKRVTPRADDLLFSYETRLGEAALMPAGTDACLGRRMALLRFDTKQVVPRYFLYLYLSPSFRELIESRTIHGATVNRIALSTMADWSVQLPSLSEQQGIAEVLGALDDKIAANRKHVDKAEELSAAIFGSMLADAVPAPLSSTAQFVNGKAFTKGASGTGRVVVRIAELNSGIGGSTVFSDAEVADQYTARPGDVLFAWSGSLTLHRWFRDEAIVNQHIFKVIPADGNPSWLVYQLIQAKLQQFKDIAADKATTMGHIQRRHLDESVPVPGREQVTKWDSTMRGLWDCALVAERESLQLATIRDTLLPQLISGKLRVRDAERQVEAAL